MSTARRDPLVEDPALTLALLEAAPVIILVLDAEGRVVHYNPCMERLCGRALDEARGLSWFEEFIPADERARLRELLSSAFTGEAVLGNISPILVRGDAPRLIEWHDRKVRAGPEGESYVVAIGVDITERLRQVEACAALALRFDLFARRVDEVLFLTTVTRDRVLYLSPAFERIVGLPREQVYADARALAAQLHPEDRARFWAAFGRVLEPGVQIEREYRLLRPDPEGGAPELRWLRIRYSRIEGAQIAGTIADVTERKLATLEREQLARLFELFDGAIDEVFFLLDARRERVLFVSESIERVFGVEREALYADIDAMLAVVHPEDRPEIQASFGRPPAEGGASSFEFRVRLPGGQQRWILSRMSTLGPNSAMPGALVALSVDISARREVEESLRRLTDELERRVAERTASLAEERERLRLILDNTELKQRSLRESLAQLAREKTRLADAQRVAQVGDWTLDLVSGACAWSDQFFRILGLEPGGVEPSHPAFLARVHPEDRARVEAALRRALDERAPYTLEHRLVRPDGGTRFVLARAELELDEEGQVLGVRGTARDISQEKLVEADLRASLAEKEALLAEVHHRVKNNLQVIVSLLHLQGSDQSAATRAALDSCRRRVRSMALIQDQLYESGQLANIDLGAFLRRLSRELEQKYAAPPETHIAIRGAGLHVDIGRAVPLALIANELLSNALEHAYPEGRRREVWIELSTRAITIEDRGVGLPVQLDPERAKTLGLRLIRILARQLEATLEFGRGAAGAGSRVRLELPPLAESAGAD